MTVVPRTRSAGNHHHFGLNATRTASLFAERNTDAFSTA